MQFLFFHAHVKIRSKDIVMIRKGKGSMSKHDSLYRTDSVLVRSAVIAFLPLKYEERHWRVATCLLYTSDAADE